MGGPCGVPTAAHEALFAGGGYVDLRHLMVLVDRAFSSGYFMEISRKGINNSNIAPLHKMSFENKYKAAVNSTVVGAVDDMDGPVQALFVGERAVVGTGATGIVQTGRIPEQVRPMESAHTHEIGRAHV